MKRLFYLLLVCISTKTVISQTLKKIAEWDIPYTANSIEVDNSGNIYLCHTRTHQISRINTEIKPCTTQTIGGRGFNQDRFQQPKKIIAKNRQAILLLDYGNQRIVILNERLRYLEEINFNKAKYPIQNPLDLAQNISGDMYLLDENVPGVSKLSAKGEFIAYFGGYDWGAGSLVEPSQITVSNANFVYVWDKAKKCIQKYDMFGVYLHTIYVESISLTKYAVSEPYIFCLSADNKLFYYDQIEKKQMQEISGIEHKIIDFAITEPLDISERLKSRNYNQVSRKIYLLTDKKVVVFEIVL
ncbi:MAG: hypothetical protein NZ519_03790 [Bacteroidia bacterium]|nr:hypothetical protein [Bacteroidia bacterium]